MIISKSSHIQKKPLAGPSLVPGGVLPLMAYTGRLPPEGVPFSGFKVGILLAEVFERVGKSVI